MQPFTEEATSTPANYIFTYSLAVDPSVTLPMATSQCRWTLNCDAKFHISFMQVSLLVLSPLWRHPLHGTLTY